MVGHLQKHVGNVNLELALGSVLLTELIDQLMEPNKTQWYTSKVTHMTQPVILPILGPQGLQAYQDHMSTCPLASDPTVRKVGAQGMYQNSHVIRACVTMTIEA